jgi:hypothetical protein
MVDKYPQFYWNSVSPHIESAIRYLNVTSRGRQWIAHLQSNVFRAEREMRFLGRSSRRFVGCWFGGVELSSVQSSPHDRRPERKLREAIMKKQITLAIRRRNGGDCHAGFVQCPAKTKQS